MYQGIFSDDGKSGFGEARQSIIDAVRERSIVCGVLLSQAGWEFSGDDTLELHFRGKSSFVLKSQNIDAFLEALISDYLGCGIRIKYIDESLKFTERNNEALERKKIEAMETAMRQESVSDENTADRGDDKPDTYRYKNPDGSVKRRAKQVKAVKELKGVVTELGDELREDEKILADGIISGLEDRMTKTGKKLIIFDLFDSTGAITVKLFVKPEKFTKDYQELLTENNAIRVYGRLSHDDYSGELTLMAEELAKSDFSMPAKRDTADVKRVELHLHTKMSQTDAVTSISDYIAKAKEYGHRAVAVTDHGVLQAYPEAMAASKKHGVKVIYGVEAYLVNDTETVAHGPGRHTLSGEFTVFDIETTGLVKECCEIIEIGAVKLKNGEITDRFSAFIKPSGALPEEITKLTGITDDMLSDAEDISAVMPRFIEFFGDSVLAAHNAAFDVSFIAWHARKLGVDVQNARYCTLELARAMYPELAKHRLDAVCGFLGVELKSHHRAVDDAEACAGIFLKTREQLITEGVHTLKEVNAYACKHMDKKKLHANHAIILVKNQTGLRNLYELVSDAHLKFFYHSPRIPKSEFTRFREGLMIGTACEAGELFTAIMDCECDGYINGLIDFYDYLEIQPIANNMFLVDGGRAASADGLREINKRIAAMADRAGKPLAAACDAHFLDVGDEIYRKILTTPKGFGSDGDRPLPLYFRTTDEMLEEFSYLGKEKCFEVVVTNTNAIADMTEELLPIPNGTFPPEIAGSEEALTEVSYARAKEIYGDPLPPVVEARIKRELDSIIKNGFAVMYIIAQKLVKKSMDDGYLVGSRGSVGSSFVAAMASITEVNPLPPHYYCSECKYTDFDSEDVTAFSSETAGASGCDMPDKMCPVCGSALKKDGHDIPFETFLGFDGDKEPDIDLNFSGEYQSKAHAFTEELFGKGHVYRAGTIGTLASKTAYGYVKKYCEERNQKLRKAEENRLTRGLTGVKKTTGQHPGGLVIVPEGRSIYEFCPIQRPANDMSTDTVTTHFDYHSISGRLLKLDILGHDVPTIIRMLQDFTGVDPSGINLADSDVISLFTSPAALGVTETQINCKTGSLGLPEFGTNFVRQMLIDTNPQSFSELVRISGLSHGTNVWLGNAHELIKKEIATLKEIIPTRDDIMIYLVNKGVEKLRAFKIMESVRKGYGVTDEEAALMRAAGVPEWYIESCRKISYMFPKGHAVAYVMMTVRIGWYKIHYPLAFYAAMYSVRSMDFDYRTMCRGKAAAKAEISRINSLGSDASAKDENDLYLLELVNEMYERGYEFAELDLYNSDAARFKFTGGKILPPLCTVAGLGENAALSLINARGDGEFISIEDFKQRTKITKTVIALMKEIGILDGLGETNQLSFL